MILRNTHRNVPLQAVRSARSGFTLLEILVVVAIIVMLAGVGGYYFVQQYEGTKVSKAKIECNALSGLVETYYLNNGVYPATIQALAEQQPSGGGPLCNPPQTIDPWGKPYQIDQEGPNNAGQRPDVFTTTPKGLVVGNFATQ